MLADEEKGTSFTDESGEEEQHEDNEEVRVCVWVIVRLEIIVFFVGDNKTT